jgi:hypothetical protein
MYYFFEKISEKEGKTGCIERRKYAHETDEWEDSTRFKKTFYFLPQIHGFILGYFQQIQLRLLAYPNFLQEYLQRPGKQNRLQ